MTRMNLFLTLLASLGRLARDGGRSQRWLRRGHSAVVNAYDVIAEPRFDQFAGGLALLQRERGGFKGGIHGKRGAHHAFAEPAQVASVSFTCGVTSELYCSFS